MEYLEFIESKKKVIKESGFNVQLSDLNNKLFDFQKYCVQLALKKGKFALFEECGLGKTFQQIEWAYQVAKYTNKPVLILCPLAVAGQTIQEGLKLGYNIVKLPSQNISTDNIYIANYEQLNNINISIFSGVVLDESSILKNYSGATKQLILDLFVNTPYKLCCSATPSPNDELEIGNHAEFLNVCTIQDMRAIYFTTDKDIIDGNKYRLKKHSQKDFYKWISSWAIMISLPSDLGFKADNYILPSLNFKEYKLITDKRDNGKLFNDETISATDFNKELKTTMIQRMDKVINLVNKSKENFIIWIKHNEEGEYLKKYLKDAIEVSGSDKTEIKEKNLLGFANNEFRVLITKTKIAQFGLNFQNCNNQIFASLDFSFEGIYQAIRRSYRFGQKNEVNIHLITTDTMKNVINSIKDKEDKFKTMQNQMKEAILTNIEKNEILENKNEKITENYKLYLGDCVEEIKKLDDQSIDYSFFSPPFGALYVFSDNPKDMSNVQNNDEFLKHFEYLVKELFRVIKPGRLVSIHMMQSTTLLGRDGFYSIVDFRGDLIRLFQKNGFYFHAENMIRKDPKTAAIRTKNRQLMHGTTKKDSSIVRPGLADYILTFKVPGENKEPIVNNIPFDLWCKIAEPVWLNINESDTLEYREAKGNNDERHITPTQLQPIEWCYLMWSNPNDTVLSPFMGIGSEGYQALKMNRKFIGFELKESYFNLACRNMDRAINENKQLTLLDLMA